MKKLLVLLSALAILAGCQQAPDNIAKVTGTVMNPDSSALIFYIDKVRDTVAMADDGSFVFEKETEKPISAMMLYGRRRATIWMAPGKSLDIAVDAADWDNSLGFSGDLQLVNEYLVEKGNIQMGWSKDYMANYMSEPEVFRSRRDSVQQVFMNLFDEYKSNGMDQQFSDREEIALRYTMYGDLNNYPNAHKYYAKIEEVNLPDDWYSFASDMDLNDPLLIEVDQAMYFLTSYVNTEAMKESGLGEDAWGTPELLAAKFKFIDDKFELHAMKERFKYDNLVQQLDAGPPTGAEEEIDSFLAEATDQEHITSITEKRDAWNPILPGQAAPAWTLPDINGKDVSLSDFKGKYVYIDFWATWCGPCLGEIPDYRTLVKDYKSRNVVFVSISVDRDKAKWEEMVNKEKFPWVQLHDANMMNDKYLVRYIPSFIFIDTEGKIIDPRAPRPSTDKLRTLLDAQPGL